MKYCKLIFFLFFATFLLSSSAIATSSGNGCKIGQDYVYTRYLGKASAYVGTPEILYYDSMGLKFQFIGVMAVMIVEDIAVVILICMVQLLITIQQYHHMGALFIFLPSRR
jgi:hypothetical protein